MQVKATAVITIDDADLLRLLSQQQPGTAAAPVAPAPAATAAPISAPTPAPVVATPITPAPAAPTAAPVASTPAPSVYTAVTIKPTAAPAAMDMALRVAYDKWKTMMVRQTKVVPGGYYIDRHHLGAGVPDEMTVSEAMGYGMVLVTQMAYYDTTARSIFDGLLAVCRSAPAKALDPALMDWRMGLTGQPIGGGYNAVDGDLDIAFALLLADNLWGSTGTPDYRSEAIRTINAIKKFNVHPDGFIMGLSHQEDDRTSDHMLGHFAAFKDATKDPFWDTVRAASLTVMEDVQARFAPNTGLLPDFVVDTELPTRHPSPGGRIENGPSEGMYSWNACRVPLRLAADYMFSYDPRVKALLSKMVSFFQAESQGVSGNINSTYALDGTPMDPNGNMSFAAPVMAGCIVDAKFQKFLDDLWAACVAQPGWGYYDKEIQLMSMLVASGRWKRPVASA